MFTNTELTLDPENSVSLRRLAHQMVDDMFDYLSNLHQRPVWQAVPETTKKLAKESLPLKGQPADSVYESFKQHILPYAMGTVHPRFWAYAGGTGSHLAMMADMLAAGMNSNVTNGDHAAMYIDQQVIEWSKEMLGFPQTGGGMLVSGCSMANITAIVVARNAFNKNIRAQGIEQKLVVYASVETHCSVQKAVEIAGIGAKGLRKIPVDKDFRMDINALQLQIAIDKKEGNLPFCIVANVGTVSTGAMDPLDELAAICKKEKFWLHIDGAFGALAKLAPAYKTQLKAIEIADSVAFDFHKWMYIPYEVGCILFKNKELQRNSFAITPPYLLRHERGLAAGPEGLNNYGIELSRGFKALKIWMSLKEHGIEKFSQLIQQNINQVLYLQTLIQKQPQLEMLTPVTLNIACFRYKPLKFNASVGELNRLNKEIVMQLHEKGLAAPSYTILDGNYVIRVANLNHRSTQSDFEVFVKEVIRLGDTIAESFKQKQVAIAV
jgi:aromatic-L-amino-acid/L-tryptophan decarboxylase